MPVHYPTHAPGSPDSEGGPASARLVVTSGLINGNTLSDDHYYDEALGLGDVLIEWATVERTAGTSSGVVLTLYDGDPTTGQQIGTLIGPGWQGVDASSPVHGPVTDVGGELVRFCSPVPAGAWLRVTNDPMGMGQPGAYAITIDYRLRAPS